jgi:hypothetical protein
MINNHMKYWNKNLKVIRFYGFDKIFAEKIYKNEITFHTTFIKLIFISFT